MGKFVLKKISKFLVLVILLSSINVALGQDGVLGVEDITFDIEGGNGADIKQTGNNRFQFNVEYDTGSSYICYWFKFKILQDAAGQQVTFRAKLPGEPFFSYNWLKPVYSYDDNNWRYIENREYESGVLRFTQTFTEDSVTVAVGFPYTLSELEAFIASLDGLSYAETEILGYSDENRPIHLVKITDPSIDDSQKKHVLVVGGQHPGETHGMLVVQGVLEHLLSSPETRSRYVYHVIPLVNVDGVYAGNTRLDTNAADLNREWDDEYKEPEIQCIYDYLAAHHFDLVIDSHTNESGYPYFGLTTGIPNYNDAIELWECIEPYTHYDRTLDSGQLAGSLRWEAYDDFGFFAVVIEHSQTNYVWSYSEYVNEGSGLVRGINDYFNVPQPNVHDIAITSVNTPNEIVVGDTINVDIDVENQGAYIETFQVESVDETTSTVIGTQTTTLQPGESTTISLPWDTTTASVGEHIIASTAGPVVDEIDIMDNTWTSTVNVEPPITDIAITQLDAPGSVEVGEIAAISVTVNNMGNQPVTDDITVALYDESGSTLIGSQTITGGLSPGEAATLTFNWDTTGATIGEHILSATQDRQDDNPTNDEKTGTITIKEKSTTMHVADIDGMKKLKGKSGRWAATITITIVDNNDNPVTDATIIGELTGDASGTITVNTGSDGKATFSTGNMPGLSSVTYTVTNITHTTLTYEPLDNQDPDGDSDGTTITINKN